MSIRAVTSRYRLVTAREPAAEPDEQWEHQLVLRLRERDEAAFAALYDRYAPAVQGLARTILHDSSLAQEATHDVFLRLWQRPENYDQSRGPFAPWLLRVTRNRAIDLLRRQREQPFAGDDAEAIGWVLDPAPDPAEQAVSLVIGQQVRAALADLSADQRGLLEMAYFGGLSQREIADHLHRPLGTVKSQIRSAMRQLAVRLAGSDLADRDYEHVSPERAPE
jgi:RNA polymerase sigma-70 factor (ECF subfamily)